MTNLPSQDPDYDMRTRWEILKSFAQVWDDPRVTSEFGRGALHPQLVKELYMMSFEVLMAQSAKQIILWASDLQVDKEKLIAQLVEATNRLELSDRDLNDTRADGRSNGQVVGRRTMTF
ncbi:hypothetical protein B296_00007840 [Ensete ventricosum]|uniref:Uncharacterized protein n=1 Tax=Ensete ventricosum TaxID=4639 RepID=A0A426ZV45_ENSVE|nr:hypothetical protein B296_00007840 [Ensete ventricosum]